MNDFKTVDVYTLDRIQLEDSFDNEQPIINSVIDLIMEEPEIMCSKGDCNGDYCPQ